MRLMQPIRIAAWRPVGAALALLLLGVAWVYRDTAVAMVAIWSRSDTFAHAYTVPPIVAWLIWRQRHALAMSTPRPSAAWLLPLAAAAMVWLLGELVAANSVTQLAFTAMLVLAAVALLGRRTAALIAFPLGFLFFAVPVGEFVMPQMMVWTADFTVQALRLSGIPVYREGLQFVIPSGHWSVVEACSGVRYLIASFMVGVLFAYLNYRSMWRRWVFAGVALAVPVLANWVRAYLIVMLGHLSGNQLATGADHLIYGWVFFGIVILLMFMIGARWAEPDAAPMAAPTLAPNERAPLDPALSLEATPASAPAFKSSDIQTRSVWAVAACALALVALPQAALWSLTRSEAGGVPVLAAPATLAAGWQRAEPRAFDWTPSFDNPSAALGTAYRSNGTEVGTEVGIYIGYYRQQTYQHKLVSSDNVLVRSKDPVWARIEEGSRRVEAAGGVVDWHSLLLRGTSTAAHRVPDRLLAWTVYWVNGHLTASQTEAKAYGALYRLLGRGDDAAVIVVYTPQTDTSAADKVLADFVRDNLPALSTLLADTRAAAQGEKK